MNLHKSWISNSIFWLAMAFVVYMPLHIFISQSFSVVTGGLEVWKAAKDVLLVVLVPLLLFISYKKSLFQDQFFRRFIAIAGLYTLLHGSFVLFNNDFTGWYAAVIGSVYNTRLFGYFLLGYLAIKLTGKEHLKKLITASVIVAFFVALFGSIQYFLPADFLEPFGYSVERGVKPLFFIDDKPDLPRVMSTIRDPNKLGAYLIMPMLFTGMALAKTRWNREFFIRPIRRSVLSVFIATYTFCMFVTFSRGAVLSLAVALGVLFILLYGARVFRIVKRYWWLCLAVLAIMTLGVVATRDTYLFKNYVFHADEATTEADPNEKRLILYDEAVDRIEDQPEGYGPGSAGLVSVKSDGKQILTENYFLQVTHEVGIIGVMLFGALLTGLGLQLFYAAQHRNAVAIVLFASFISYIFYSLLVHLWSNEAVALQFWLLTGALLELKSASDKRGVSNRGT